MSERGRNHRVRSTTILTDEEISALMSRIEVLFDGRLRSLVRQRRELLEAELRLDSLGARCRLERDRRALTVKAAALKLRVPQYRLHAIESPDVRDIDPRVLSRYVTFLGLGRWYRRWLSANEPLAWSMGLARRVRFGPPE